MEWSSQQSSTVVLGLGVLVIVISVAVPDVVVWHPIALGIGGVYATTALLFTLYETYGAKDAVPFTYALFVALIAVAVGYSLEAVQWLTSIHGDSIVDFVTVLWTPYGVVPFVVAFLSPYAIAGSEMQRKQVTVLVGIVFVVVINVNLYTSGSLIPGLSLLYILYQIVVGLIVGVPMYLYSRSLRTR